MFHDLDINVNLHILSFLDPLALKNYQQTNKTAYETHAMFTNTPSLMTPFLVKHKGKLNTFHYALENNHPAIVNELLKDATPQTFRQATQYAIHTVTSRGDLALLAHLIATLQPRQSAINHALLIAAENNHSHLTRFLLEQHRADPNYSNTYGTRPIESAISRDNITVLNQLLQYNADIHYDNEFPIRLATSFDHTGIALALLHHGALLNTSTDAPLMLAIENQNLTLATHYLQHGADPLIRENCLIKKVAWIGHLPLFQLLITHGASLALGLKIAKYRKHANILEAYK